MAAISVTRASSRGGITWPIAYATAAHSLVRWRWRTCPQVRIMTFRGSNDESPIGKEWKDYWREVQSDPDLTRHARKKIRAEKEAARRRVHRKVRRDSRRALKQLLDR